MERSMQSNPSLPEITGSSQALRGFLTATEAWMFAVFFALSFLGLGGRGLIEPDEGRYSEIAREMLKSGDWMMPTLNGFVHPQKPPLIYWASASSMALFGENEFAARLPAAMAGFGTLVMAFLLARAWFGRSAAFATALTLAGSVEFFALSRTLTPDMLMTFWITASMAAFAVATSDPARRRWIWLFFIGMGLGFLTKGPMALAVPLSGAICWQIHQRRAGFPTRIPWALGGLLTLLIAFSWFIAVCAQHYELVRFYLHDELFARVATNNHGRSKPIYFFIPVLGLGILPWIFFAPQTARWAWKLKRAGQFDAKWWFVTGALIIPFCVLSFARSKLITYILPLIPVAAVIIGAWAAAHNFRRHCKIAAVALVLWSIAGLQSDRFNNVLGRQASMKTLAEAILADDLDATVFAYNANVPGLAFYLRQTIAVSNDEADDVLRATSEARPVLKSPADCEKLRIKDEEVYGVTLRKNVTRNFPPEKWQVVKTAGDYALIRLISGRPAAWGAN